MADRDATEDALVKDAEHVLAAYDTHKDAFAAADAKRKKKLLPPSVITGLIKSLAQVDAGMMKSAAGGATVESATSDEAEIRATLAEKVVGIREEIRVTYDGDKPIQKVYGVGARLNPKSTKSLARVAGMMVESFGDKKHASYKKKALDAGITEARMAEVSTLRTQLLAANTMQATAVKTRVGTTRSKRAAIATMTKATAWVRRAAAVVFRNNPEILAEFESTRAKLSPARRKPRKPPAPTKP